MLSSKQRAFLRSMPEFFPDLCDPGEYERAARPPAVHAERRGAAFVSAVACVFPKGYKVHIPDAVRTEKNGLAGFVVRGECRGTILREGRGCDGFGYDPLFYVAEKGRTFAELSSDEKNAISHRGVAMRAFCRQFLSLFEN